MDIIGNANENPNDRHSDKPDKTLKYRTEEDGKEDAETTEQTPSGHFRV